MRPLTPPLLQHAHAVDDGKAQVEHHSIIGFGVAEEVPLLAVLGGIDGIARILQRRGQLAAEVRIILDDEKAHALSRYCDTWPVLASTSTWITVPPCFSRTT